MVNVPGRSKGCLRCRQRKVKCDLSLPECFQCQGMRLPCPGARTGVFFMHTVPVPAPHKRSPPPSWVDSCPGSVPLKNSGENLEPILQISPLSHFQPSRADFFDHIFVAHFIESFGNLRPPPSAVPSTTWLNELPLLVASPRPSLAKHAIRAGSMLLYGTHARDVSIQTEARRWYARVLRDLRSLLLRVASASDSSIPFSEEAICAAVMLSHFETVAGTSPGSWVQHVEGAAKMLETLGPESCRLGFTHQIFRHLRLLTLIATMAQNKLHPFGSHRWVTIPFQTYQKIPFDILVDILFSVSRCLVMAQSLINSARKKADISATKLRTLLRETASQIDMWWSEGISGPNFEKRSASFSPNPANCTRDASSWSLCPFKKVDYYDLPTAALSALYDAANMIIFSLLFFVTPSGNTYEERIQLHAQSIISSYEFIHANNCPDPDRGSLMILLPLKVVSLWSPSQTLKIRASEIISSLSGNEGFSEVISNGLFKDVAAYVCSQQGGRADSAASLPSKGRGNRDMRDSKIILTAD